MRLTHSILFLCLLTLSSCYNMRDADSVKTYEKTNLGHSKHPPKGVVPFHTENSAKVSDSQGRQLYEIHCQVCHGEKGKGNHDLGKYGLPYPPSFHLPSLQEEDLSYFIDVMTHGRGVMVSYRGRLTPTEREQIARYIKKLQEEIRNSGGQQ